MRLKRVRWSGICWASYRVPSPMSSRATFSNARSARTSYGKAHCLKRMPRLFLKRTVQAPRARRESHARYEQVRVPWWTWLWQRPWTAAPALAAIALLCVSAYQALVVIPGLRGQLREALSPQPVSSYVLPSLSRGDDRALEVAKDSRFYALYM